MPRCGFFGSSPMMAFVVIPKILITTCCGLCGAFNMDVAVSMDAWSLSIFLMLPGMGFILMLMMAFGVNSKTLVNKGASSLHVGGSTRGHMMAFVPRKLPAHTRWLSRLYLELLRVGSVAWPPHFEHVRMLLFRWGGQATTLFVFSGAFKFEEVLFLG
ncbi:hypothetical protein VNO77_26659 [Canavalia gladiata]|uniref:Uncharacterized protein n=1 Tax=Canavalia gladiata TaxID=3824 RepID=A0AAN9Q3J6_CANGL